MRNVKSFSDVQIVLNDILNRFNELQTKSWDRHKLQIKNAAPGTDPNDYVILSQLPEVQPPGENRDQHYTQVWSNGGTAVVGAAIPPFIPGKFREGTPVQAWVACTTAPTSANLTINIQLNGTNLLTADLSLPNGTQGPVFSSAFITPTPYMKYSALVIPVITGVASAAAAVSIGLVIQRSRSKGQ